MVEEEEVAVVLLDYPLLGVVIVLLLLLRRTRKCCFVDWILLRLGHILNSRNLCYRIGSPSLTPSLPPSLPLSLSLSLSLALSLPLSPSLCWMSDVFTDAMSVSSEHAPQVLERCQQRSKTIK